MAQCNIVEALKYIEDLYSKASSDKKNVKNKTALYHLFNDINQQRAIIQQAASFAGLKGIDIFNSESSRRSQVEEKVEEVEDIPPWEDAPSFEQKLSENYAKMAKEIINFVKSKKQVTISMNKALAVRIAKTVGRLDGYAWHKPEGKGKSNIRYPDFDAVLNDEAALTNIAKSLKVTVEDARNIVLSHRKSNFFGMTRLHEHIHAGAVEFMRANPNDSKTQYVNKLFEKVKKLADTTNPALSEIQGNYWRENVDEFLAVALSNPEMMSFLNDMPATGFVSTLHKLVNTLASMVGIKQGSENEALLNIFTQMTEASLEEEPTNPDNGNQLELFQGIDIGELNDIINEVSNCKSKG